MSGLNAMLYGKHKGVPIDEVPVDYLRWVLAQEGTRPATAAMCQASIARRQAGQGNKAVVASKPKAASAHVSGAGVACPACGAMLQVTLSETLVDDDDPIPF